MANELDNFFTPASTLANPQGFSEPAGNQALDSFFAQEPEKNLDQILAEEPDDLPVEAADEDQSFWEIARNTLKSPEEYMMDVAYTIGQPSTWAGLGTAISENWERTKLGFQSLAMEGIAGQLESMVERPAEAEGKSIADSELNEVYQRTRESLEREAAVTPKGLNLLQQGIRGAVTSAPQAVATVGAMALGAPAGLMVAANALPVLGSSKAEAGAGGVTGGEGTLKASLDAGLEAVFSFMPLKSLGSLMKAASSGSDQVVKEAADMVAKEMVGEQLTTATQSLNAYSFGLDKELENAETWAEAAEIQARRQVVTAISTALLSGATAGGIAAMKAPKAQGVDSVAELELERDQALAAGEPPTPQTFVGPLISQDLRSARDTAAQAEAKLQRVADKAIAQADPLTEFFEIPSMVEPDHKNAQIDHMKIYDKGTWTSAPEVIAKQTEPQVYTTDMNDWLEFADQKRQLGTPEGIAEATQIQSNVQKFADFNQTASRLVDKWRKDLLPQTTIVLGAVDPRVPLTKQGSARISKGVGRILTQPLNYQGKEFSEGRAYSTLAHEFGHLFANTEYEKLGPKAKLALETEYQAWRSSHQPNTPMSVVADSRATPVESIEAPMSSKVTLEQATTQDPAYMEYYLSRQEYLAQQMARYQSYDKNALKVAKPFFASLVAKLRKFHQKYKKDFAPTQTFEAWVQNLSAQNQVARLEATETERTAAAWEEINTESVDQISPAMYPMANAANVNYAFKEWRKVYGNLAPTPTQRISSLGGGFSSPQYKAETETGTDNMSRFKKNALTLLQNAKNNPHIPGLLMGTPEGGPGFVKVFEDHLSFKRAENTRMDKFLRDWRKLGVHQVVHIGELAMKVDELSRETGMRLLPSDIAREAKFLGVTEEGLAFYNRMQGELERKLDQLEQELTKRANRRGWADEDGKAQYLASVKARISALKNTNYFPATRFGDHVVMVTAKTAGEYKGKFYMPGETLLREHYESEAEADDRAASLRKQNIGQQHTVGRDKIANYDAATYMGMPPILLEELLARLPEDQHPAIRAAMAAAAPGQGFAKHLIKKQGISGASKNFRRAYMSYMESFNRHMSRIMDEDLFDNAIQAVNQSAENLVMQGKSAGQRRLVQEMMVDTKNYLYNPGEEFRAWGALAFNYYLTGVPKHALLAMVQLPMVSFPNLTAQYGSLPTTKAFTRAAGRIYSKSFRPELLPKPLQDALQQAEKDGIIEETLARELSALAQSNNLERLIPKPLSKGDTISTYWSTFANIAGAMFHHAEKFARTITFHTAWELEYAVKGDSVAAYTAAKDAVQKGHFVFTAANNPPIMRGKTRPLFVFQTHVQGMLEFLLGSNNPGAWRGMAMLFLAAGATGLPFAEDLEELINWMIKKYNRLTGNYSTVPTLKETIRGDLVEMMDFTGKDSAKLLTDLALDGAGKWGFGLPWVADMTGIPLGSFDLTPSLGLGSIIPGMKGLGANNWNDTLAQATEGIAGPALGIPLGMMQAVVESQASDEWRLGKFLPAMIENPLKARDWADGSIEDKYGRKVLDFDVNNPSHQADAIWQALGMVPTRLSVERDARWAAQKVNEYYATSRSMLIMQMEDAVKSQEKEVIADVTKAIHKYNDTVPHPGYKLNASAIISGVKTRMQRDLQQGMGLPQRKMDTMATQELRDIFPVEGGD